MRSIGDEVVEFLIADEFVSAFVYFVEYVLCFVLQDGFINDLHDLAEFRNVKCIPLFRVKLFENLFDIEVVGLDDVFQLANDAVELLVHSPFQLFFLLQLFFPLHHFFYFKLVNYSTLVLITLLEYVFSLFGGYCFIYHFY